MKLDRMNGLKRTHYCGTLTKNEIGQEVALIAEVFLNKDKVEELKLQKVEEKLKTDISEACKELPIYKRISDIEIRKEEFAKTTTNKIKR